MTSSSRPGRFARRLPMLLLLACLLAPAGARAAAAPAPAGGELSPRLAELAQPAVRALPRVRQSAHLGLAASGPGSLLRRGKRVLAYVRFEGGAGARAEALREAGAQVLGVSPAYQTDTVAVSPGRLPALAGVAGVAGVSEVLRPLVAAACPSGAAVSEGDQQLEAARARADFNLDGAGVTVGILSDSFDRNAAAVTDQGLDAANGDLPGPGNPCGFTIAPDLLDDSYEPLTDFEPPPSDEGRAMAQIVHDLAPGSPLAFATAFDGELAFAQNIQRLAAPPSAGGAGAQVIADDVTYLEEPFFQDGPVAVAADEVAGQGVSYFSAAGNDNLVDKAGNDIASWEAPEFRDSGECPRGLVEFSEEWEREEAELIAEGRLSGEPEGLHPSHCMDFDPAKGSGATKDTFGITVEPESSLTVDLQWAEPWNGVDTDLDAFLLDAATGEPVEEDGEPLLQGIEDNIGVSQKPVELLVWENKSQKPREVELAINEFGHSSPAPVHPRLKAAFLEDGSGISETQFPVSREGDVVGPTIFGHAGASGVIAVGAVHYDNDAALEPYSSHGPVTQYFGPVRSAGPANPIPPPAAPIAPREIAKPDLVASDCGVTSFFFRQDPGGAWRFCGSSASAPHAAAVAALVRQADPGASAAAVRGDLEATARPVGASGPDEVGAGLVDAYGAVSALALPPAVTITKAPPPISKNRQPTVEFTASRPVAFFCMVDGGPPQSCQSPYTVPQKLGEGEHGIAVVGRDAGGREGSAGVASFRIDFTPPRTKIAKHPRKLIRTRRRNVRARFRFRSNEAGARFICKVDRDLKRFCPANFAHRFRPGKQAVRVWAVDAAENVDRTPALFRFRVKRIGHHGR